MSKRIVFFTGYSANKWNLNTKLPGGSEVAVANIAQRLYRYGHEVWVAGDVITEDINGIKFRDYDSFVEEFKNKPDYFDLIIGVNYIHFKQYAEDSNQLRAKQVFYMHNEVYFPWYKGEEIPDHEEQFRNIEKIVCVSTWQAFTIMDKYNITCDDNLEKIITTQNGINHNEFKYNVQKDPNKFIWSSAIDRGLDDLLDNWYKVREIMPDATLDVYYPKYSDPRGKWGQDVGPRILEKLEKNKHLGVKDMGSVSQSELHLAMCKATYWMYLTDYEETFCITALEMTEAGVTKITTDVAALAERNTNGICIPRRKSEVSIETIFDEAIQIIKKAPSTLREKAVWQAKLENKIYTWDIPTLVFNDIARN